MLKPIRPPPEKNKDLIRANECHIADLASWLFLISSALSTPSPGGFNSAQQISWAFKICASNLMSMQNLIEALFRKKESIQIKVMPLSISI